MILSYLEKVYVDDRLSETHDSILRREELTFVWYLFDRNLTLYEGRNSYKVPYRMSQWFDVRVYLLANFARLLLDNFTALY